MRSWYVIHDGKETMCEFVSVNVLKLYMWLKLDGISFKITYHNKKDYEYAKRGESINAIAHRKNTYKSIKIVFK